VKAKIHKSGPFLPKDRKHSSAYQKEELKKHMRTLNPAEVSDFDNGLSHLTPRAISSSSSAQMSEYIHTAHEEIINTARSGDRGYLYPETIEASETSSNVSHQNILKRKASLE
jgi:hypothetical protein